MDGDTLMMIPTDILAPRPRRGRLLGRMTENALFWAVLILLGIGAVTSFYYEQQITASSPDKAHESVSALPDAGLQGQRILRYQMQNGQLTVYP